MTAFAIRRPVDLPGVEVASGQAGTRISMRHMHENHRVGVTTAGIIRTRYRSRTYEVGPGTVQLAEPGATSVCEIGSDGQTFMTVEFADNSLQSGSATSGLRSDFPAHVIDDTQTASLITQFVTSVMTDEGLLERSSRLQRLLEAVLPVRTPAESTTPAPHVLAAKEFIDDDPTAEVTLSDLAELCGLSAYHFSRQFRRHVGLPPHAYQLHRRIEIAKRELAQDVTLVELAHDLGFYDQSHFVRHFRTRVGMTPAAYRQALAA